MAMTNLQIEQRVLRAIEALRADQLTETSEIELKESWPATDIATARRLAGHANASRGEAFLWIIGVDQRNKLIPGAPETEIANWWPQVQARFDESMSPGLDRVLAVPVDAGISVVALLFDSSRAPYVVKLPNTGPADREVPWREANRTRSARRIDLVALTQVLEDQPTIELFSPEVQVLKNGASALFGHHIVPGNVAWSAQCSLYIVPASTRVIHIPHHHLTLECKFPTLGVTIPFEWRIQLEPPKSVDFSDGTMSVHRPALISLWASGDGPPVGPEQAVFAVRVEVVRGARPILLEVPLVEVPHAPNVERQWAGAAPPH